MNDADARGPLLPGDPGNLVDQRLADRQFMHGSDPGSQHLVVKFPGRACLLGRDPLNCIANMNDNMITGGQGIVLQHEQADIALDALGFATRHITVYFPDFHRYTQAHDFSPAGKKAVACYSGYCYCLAYAFQK